MKIIPLSAVIGFGMLTLSGQSVSQEKYKNLTFVGAGATFGESVFSTDGASAGADLYLFHHSQYGFIDGSLANLALMPWFGLSANLRISEVSDTFNEIPIGINDRESNGELGVTIGSLGARVTYLHDVTDKHNGYEVQVHLGQVYDTPIQDLSFSPYVQINFRDKKLSGHTYNISAEESVASGLAVFESPSTMVYQTGLIALYDVSENLLGISKLELEHHDSKSPLLQNETGWQLSAGITYRF